MLGDMDRPSLRQLLDEVDSTLQGKVSDADRNTLQQTRADLDKALSTPPKPEATPDLRERLQAALERLEGEHPNLTALISNTLDALSDVGL
jgi:broad specificity phosphatase PhoE